MLVLAAPLVLSLTSLTSPTSLTSLTSWLRSFPGAQIGPLELGPSRLGGGTGAFLTADVREGDVLLAIPAAACPSLSMALSDDEVGEKLEPLTKLGPGGATVALAGFLAYRWCVSGPEGEAGAYLRHLTWERRPGCEHVVWWSEEEVDALLRGSTCLEDARGVRAEVELGIRAIRGLLLPSVAWRYATQGRAPWAADAELKRAARGAFVAILTRAFTVGDDVEGGEGGEPAAGERGAEEQRGVAESQLVPWLDMFQHGEEPSIRYIIDADAGAVVTARRPLPAGHELVNNYGKLSDSKFFTRFGFVPGGGGEATVESAREMFEQRSPVFFPGLV